MIVHVHGMIVHVHGMIVHICIHYECFLDRFRLGRGVFSLSIADSSCVPRQFPLMLPTQNELTTCRACVFL